MVPVLLRIWAWIGIARGWLYQQVERFGHCTRKRTRVRNLRGGIRMSLDLKDHVQQKIYYFGAYEPIEVELLSGLIQPGDVVIDGGANVGFYTLALASRVGPSGRVIAFEPVPSNLERLKKNLHLNSGMKQIQLVESALWNQPDRLKLSQSDHNENNAGTFSVAQSSQGNQYFECPAVRLDDMVKQSGVQRVAAIKLDIEGAEKWALQGAATTLRESKPVVALEVCQQTCKSMGYDAKDLWGFFQDLDYRIYRVGSTYQSSGFVKDLSGIENGNVLLVHGEAAKKLESFRWNEKKIFRSWSRV